jgi:predicted Ser/Thr protein kinase
VTELPKRIGRYHVVDAIGKGGMGSVYLARDPAIGRLLAIKLLKEEYDEDQRSRFEREASSVGQLQHGNIVTIYDVGQHDGRPFIAMSYVAGETLSELIARQAPIPVVRKLKIIEELCAGLHAAHKAGIVHRDIKPANVMVDTAGTVKILDFGIARLTSEATQKTQEGTVIGSYNYMSPEQIVGKPLNHRSDIFAVGAVFYELLSYARAFGGSLRDGLWYRLVHEAPPPLRDLCNDLDPEIERIVMHALEKDPANRYQEIELMRRDVSRAKRRLAGVHLAESIAAAEKAINDGDFSGALAHAQAALDIEPDDARAIDLAETARKALDERQIKADEDRQRADEVAALARLHDAETREARQLRDRALGLHESGDHRSALKLIDSASAHVPDGATTLRGEIDALRDTVEDAFARTILDAERAREAAALLARTAARDPQTFTADKTPPPVAALPPEPTYDPDTAPTVVVVRPVVRPDVQPVVASRAWSAPTIVAIVVAIAAIAWTIVTRAC